MTKTMTRKTTSTRTSTKKGEKLPADLGVHQMFSAVEKKVKKLNLPDLTARDLLYRYFCECGEDIETILLDWIEAVGYLDDCRGFLNGQLAEAAAERRASRPIPADLPLGVAWEMFRSRLGGDCNSGDIAHFIENNGPEMDDHLIEIVEEEGLEDEFREWMNNYLGHRPKKKRKVA